MPPEVFENSQIDPQKRDLLEMIRSASENDILELLEVINRASLERIEEIESKSRAEIGMNEQRINVCQKARSMALRSIEGLRPDMDCEMQKRAY